MSNIVIGLLVMLSITGMMMLGQAALLEVNPAGTTFFECKGSLIGALEASSCTSSNYIIANYNASTQLPSTQSSVSPTTGNIFTDTPTSIKIWLLSSIPGLDYLYALVGAPYTILSAIGMPSIISFVFSVIWYGTMLILIVAFIMGRND